ncbi:DUF2254 family protein [Salsipaludibacter albus]|uniref:DUF2254 family protein n=1 Tax=Salsipaludibacter albus TaxID=2849650 RepID=UPI001EE4777A|nr:DUF2254 domain-containing protein [Salsipaludibacter albus]
MGGTSSLRIVAGTGAGVLAGVALAWASNRWLAWSPPQPFTLGPSTAQALLVGVLGALFTLAAFAFWMRTIAVNLVAGTVPPGVLAAYLGDRFQANLLVATASAVAFVSTILVGLPDGSGEDVQLAGVIASVLLAIASLATLLVAMTRSLAAVDPSRVLRAISARATAHLDRPDDRTDDPAAAPDRSPDQVLLSPATGWVGDVDPATILGVLPPGACARIDVSAGDFVMAGTRVGLLWDGHGSAASPEEVIGHLTIRADRSRADDVVFAIDQIVDIGSRALRAQARDMTLAREAIGHVGLIMFTTMERRGAGPNAARDQSGTLVVAVDHLAWPDLLRRAFEPLRIDGARWPVVARQLLSTLGAIHERRGAQQDEPTARELRRLAHATVDECRAGDAIEADVRDLVTHARRLGLLDDEA